MIDAATGIAIDILRAVLTSAPALLEAIAGPGKSVEEYLDETRARLASVPSTRRAVEAMADVRRAELAAKRRAELGAGSAEHHAAITRIVARGGLDATELAALAWCREVAEAKP